MKDLIRVLCGRLQAGQGVAVATIVYQAGSAPRGAGSQLLADTQGLIVGTVGGGLAEAKTLEACGLALKNRQPWVLDFDLSGELAARAEMICGGKVRVLVEPFFPGSGALEFFLHLHSALEGQGALLLRPFPPKGLRPGDLLSEYSLLPLEAGQPNLGLVRGAALAEPVCKALQSLGTLSTASVLELGGQQYFVEPCVPPWRMIIAGGGHVSLPTAQMASLAGFAVQVLDDRPEFVGPERFPWAVSTRLCPDFADCFSGQEQPDAHSCIVIVTRGHLHDGQVLAQALKTDAGYIGMIGSVRKRDAIYADLLRPRPHALADSAALARVHCPIGLPIGAETPEEIAVSIVAECIAHKNPQK